MKKIISFVLLLTICCVACSCDPGTFLIDRESLNDIVSIELIEYKNPNQKHFNSWVPNHFDKLAPFIPENAKVVETLPTKKISDFLDSFSKTDILHTYYAYDSPKDFCVRCNYKNGNFLIIWANYSIGSYAGYIGEYELSGQVLSFWGCFSSLQYYEDLVSQYFGYDIYKKQTVILKND